MGIINVEQKESDSFHRFSATAGCGNGAGVMTDLLLMAILPKVPSVFECASEVKNHLFKFVFSSKMRFLSRRSVCCIIGLLKVSQNVQKSLHELGSFYVMYDTWRRKRI